MRACGTQDLAHSTNWSRSSPSSAKFLVSSNDNGAFYRTSKAFLHFHEDVSGLHADVRIGQDFERFPVRTSDERARLLAHVRTAEQPVSAGASRCMGHDAVPSPNQQPVGATAQRRMIERAWRITGGQRDV